ncbi:T6SS phospholipase effector Tle1-like catalytic domain-containing protein [Aspergillus stella-maris]|uniref:T6SS phospholipase effector Tle1-like catalytic domain-containing protein n=1 Tax=Aspergillus stella-maris TaxID=1810926 RepID=UPI003CCE26D8
MTTKRLIVCCDGTWQDATADTSEPPSNVTRISRALSRIAIVEDNGSRREIPQIMYYQKGVGTGLGDKYFGGVTGVGLSANVRAAYGFLADNYADGDKIYFFGFSRGAYTARAVAGLVCQWGLLTPRGMDNFATVYDDFYGKKIEGYSDEKRRQLGFRDPLPRFTVEVIGVWDTVGFHKPWLGKWFGEQLEFRNTFLSREVRHAYHALALDEERTAYQPTLWHKPDDSDGTELLQVWFSGAHTDVGGGGTEPRLSNIALGWMIAQCSKYNQLAFDAEEYLFDHPPRPAEAEMVPWATALGEVPHGGLTRTLEGVLAGKSSRTPLAYKQPGSMSRPTNEFIHVSIKDRLINKDKVAGAVRWISSVVEGRHDNRTWQLDNGYKLVEDTPEQLEYSLKGRIRTVHVDEED